MKDVLLIRDRPERFVSGPLIRRDLREVGAVVIIPPETDLDALVEALARKVCADNPEETPSEDAR